MINFFTDTTLLTRQTVIKVVCLIIVPLSMSGCFTGIESTPAIKYKETEDKSAILTPEQKYLDDITGEPPANWAPGKRFVVTDRKIAVLFNNTPSLDYDSVAGKLITYAGAEQSQNIYGSESVSLKFSAPDGTPIVYSMPMSYGDFIKKDQIDIPYAIDIRQVEEANSRMAGNTYYVTTPRWLDAAGAELHEGLRHVPVTVSQVVAGNQYYPLRVIFHPQNSSDEYSLYMTLGRGRTSTRNFDTLFAFDNPRLRHPDITDEVWDLIIHSKVKEGMTREECRLALGAPTVSGERPTTSGMVEYWTYADGIYLIFEEGLLSSYRR